MGKSEADGKRSLPIGVFDSGVGGLTIMTVMKAMFPHENFVYVGDNAHNPVGNKSNEEITDIAVKIGEYLEAVPVKMAVVACNTFTVVALEELQRRFAYPLVGVCKGVHTAVDISPRKSIGILATAATINSHKHRDAALALDPTEEVWEQACPELAQLIESGHIADDVVYEKVEEYLQPLLDAKVDTIVLGCTHFPFIKKLLEKITGHSVVYVNPAYETAEEVRRVLVAQNMENQQREKGILELCFTKNVEQATQLASCLIPPKEFSIRQISL